MTLPSASAVGLFCLASVALAVALLGRTFATVPGTTAAVAHRAT